VSAAASFALLAAAAVSVAAASPSAYRSSPPAPTVPDGAKAVGTATSTIPAASSDAASSDAASSDAASPAPDAQPGSAQPGNVHAEVVGSSGTLVPPDGLGDDGALDALAEQCYSGELRSCDLLFLSSPVGSDYEAYGDTCAGRQEAGTGRYCALGREPGDVPGGTTIPGTLPPPTTAPTSSTPGGTGTLPPATLEPTGLGDDPALDALAESCYEGDMAGCDELWRQSPSGSDYEHFADTCAGRQPAQSGSWCATTFPGASSEVTTSSAPPSTGVITTYDVPTTTSPGTDVPAGLPPATVEPTGLGDDPLLDELAQACYEGDMAGCDDLWRQSGVGSAYQDYADTCAGRQPALTGSWCQTTFPDAPPPSTPASTAPVVTTPVVTTPSTIVPIPSTVPPPSTTNPPTTLAGGELPPATVEPTGLGDDPELDALAQACYDGDLQSCDDLWRQSDIDTAYHDYADTCAGRQDAGTLRWCVDAFPGVAAPTTTVPPTTTTLPSVATGVPPATQEPTGLGSDPALDALAQQCYDGAMLACDALFDAAPMKSAYQAYGDTCAGRQPPGTFKYCRATFPN